LALAPRGGGVVGARGGVGRREGAEPHSDAAHGVADLRRPLAPRPLPHAVVLPERRVLGSAGCENRAQRGR
jgi:hypothetical protein